MKKILSILSLALSMVAMAPAAVVTFTGGTAYWNDHNEPRFDPATGTETTIFVPAGSGVTAGNELYRSVDYYVESGFKFDYLGGTGGSIGNYYNIGNDVIHAHWGVGEMTGIEISKNGGGTFEFNYFVLTSNTLTPGGDPTGFEDVHVQAWRNGTQVGSDVILPPEQWGFPALDVFFGTDFDLVDKIVITSTHTSFSCFGMDSFYIDQAAPVPEPSVAALMVLGAGALLALKRRRSAV
jgi:hypothetical protein